MINKCQHSGIIKSISALLTAALLIMSLFAIPAYAVENSDTSKRLVLFQGFILHAYFDNKYVEVKRLSPQSGIFYGYGWLDDHTVFIAYQREGYAEAIADFEVVDLLKKRTTKLDGIGGTGESNFDVNPTTGEIIFSNGDDINFLKLDAKRKLISNTGNKKERILLGSFLDRQ